MIVDLFAGGGGASLGIQWATGRAPDLAVNHDHHAIQMHAANHPETHHEEASVWEVRPASGNGARPGNRSQLAPVDLRPVPPGVHARRRASDPDR